MYGWDCVSFLMSFCVRFLDSESNSMLLISSCEMILKPARCGGVKNGLKVLTAHGPSKLTRHPFVMFVAMPVCTIMSAVCHWVNSLVATVPLFDLRRARSLVVGSICGFSPSVVLANWMIFLNVGSSFFQVLSSPSSFSSSACANLLLFWFVMDSVSLLIPSTMFVGLDGGVSLFVFMCVL